MNSVFAVYILVSHYSFPCCFAVHATTPFTSLLYKSQTQVDVYYIYVNFVEILSTAVRRYAFGKMNL